MKIREVIDFSHEIEKKRKKYPKKNIETIDQHELQQERKDSTDE